jgi:DNA modification methylase
MLIRADARRVPLRDACVQCCVTSPPFWGLRSYPDARQIGLEPTPDAYVQSLVQVFREVWRVLKDDGTVWLNLGDSYHGGGGYAPNAPSNLARALGERNGAFHGESRHTSLARVKPRRSSGADPNAVRSSDSRAESQAGLNGPSGSPTSAPDPVALKPKDLVGIPWRVAFALQADGWYLRSDIIWSKPSPMPESVRDRPTRAHEYIFLLTKADRYYYDANAIAEAATDPESLRGYTRAYATDSISDSEDKGYDGHRTRLGLTKQKTSGVVYNTRNKRSVWHVATEPYAGAHFATFPQALIEPCILAGSRIGDRVLDPFIGSGTTGAVCDRLMRRWVGTDLSYQALSSERTTQRGLRYAE